MTAPSDSSDANCATSGSELALEEDAYCAVCLAECPKVVHGDTLRKCGEEHFASLRSSCLARGAGGKFMEQDLKCFTAESTVSLCDEVRD